MLLIAPLSDVSMQPNLHIFWQDTFDVKRSPKICIPGYSRQGFTELYIQWGHIGLIINGNGREEGMIESRESDSKCSSVLALFCEKIKPSHTMDPHAVKVSNLCIKCAMIDFQQPRKPKRNSWKWHFVLSGLGVPSITWRNHFISQSATSTKEKGILFIHILNN